MAVSKRQTTFAKKAREQAVKDKRVRKAEKKQAVAAAKLAAAENGGAMPDEAGVETQTDEPEAPETER